MDRFEVKNASRIKVIMIIILLSYENVNMYYCFLLLCFWNWVEYLCFKYFEILEALKMLKKTFGRNAPKELLWYFFQGSHLCAQKLVCLSVFFHLPIFCLFLNCSTEHYWIVAIKEGENRVCYDWRYKLRAE